MAAPWSETWTPNSWAASSWWQNSQISPTWTTPPPPPTETAPSLPPWPPAPPSRSTPPAAPADPRTTFKEDDEHYDANLVFKSTLRKTVEPSAWSRAKGLAGMDIRDVTVAHLSRRGLEEYGRRPLSHGRLTGIFLTRNVAETVLLSQIQKRLREDNIDVDATIEAIYKSKNLKPPDKVKEATNFVTPLVDEIFSAMKPWTQVKNYGKNPEQDNQVAQRMQELEEEAAKYKQRLKSAGMEVTPTKVLPLQPPPPSAPSDSQQTPSPSHQALRSGPPPDSAQEVPPTKRRRTQRGEKKKQYEKLIDEPYNVIKQSGQQPPTSMTSIKAWVTNLKKTMPADKHKEPDQHICSKSTTCWRRASTPRCSSRRWLQGGDFRFRSLRQRRPLPQPYSSLLQQLLSWLSERCKLFCISTSCTETANRSSNSCSRWWTGRSFCCFMPLQ